MSAAAPCTAVETVTEKRRIKFHKKIGRLKAFLFSDLKLRFIYNIICELIMYYRGKDEHQICYRR